MRQEYDPDRESKNGFQPGKSWEARKVSSLRCVIIQTRSKDLNKGIVLRVQRKVHFIHSLFEKCLLSPCCISDIELVVLWVNKVNQIMPSGSFQSRGRFDK